MEKMKCHASKPVGFGFDEGNADGM